MDYFAENDNIQLIDINPKIFHKMLFCFKCLEDGWTVSKKSGKYIFTRQIKGNVERKEYESEEYLEKFLIKYMNV
jgi:hypothetical protein